MSKTWSTEATIGLYGISNYIVFELRLLNPIQSSISNSLSFFGIRFIGIKKGMQSTETYS
ncbi:hypothetical protein PIROE2DRAFT_3439 [Piromyces sp. E2]|nr:hypothetical protein PIROE2DRAFT_3439 [Piromyces sp. E2]|eukprot:OUM68753.1 hypothetical protein PIROE2DRAFT_3439 [Piromyces sp. E2]